MCLCLCCRRVGIIVILTHCFIHRIYHHCQRWVTKLAALIPQIRKLLLARRSRIHIGCLGSFQLEVCVLLMLLAVSLRSLWAWLWCLLIKTGEKTDKAHYPRLFVEGVLLLTDRSATLLWCCKCLIFWLFRLRKYTDMNHAVCQTAWSWQAPSWSDLVQRLLVEGNIWKLTWSY